MKKKKMFYSECLVGICLMLETEFNIFTITEQGKTTYSNLIKLAKLQCPVSVDWRPDVLAVVAVLHRLQLPNAAHIGQPSLNLCHVQHL